MRCSKVERIIGASDSPFDHRALEHVKMPVKIVRNHNNLGGRTLKFALLVSFTISENLKRFSVNKNKDHKVK